MLELVRVALRGEPGIFQCLKAEHRELARLMQRMHEGRRDDDAARQRRLFSRVRAELLAHTGAERRVFYPLAERSRSLRRLAARGRDEHAAIEELLDQLGRRDVTSPGWMNAYTRFQHRVLEHMHDEERQLMPAMRKLLSRLESLEMERRYRAEKELLLGTLASEPEPEPPRART